MSKSENCPLKCLCVLEIGAASMQLKKVCNNTSHLHKINSFIVLTNLNPTFWDGLQTLLQKKYLHGKDSSWFLVQDILLQVKAGCSFLYFTCVFYCKYHYSSLKANKFEKLHAYLNFKTSLKPIKNDPLHTYLCVHTCCKTHYDTQCDDEIQPSLRFLKCQQR